MKILLSVIRKSFELRPNLIKIVENISWLLLDKFFRMGVGLIVGVWFARYFGPEKFGLFNYALAYVGLFTVLSGLGLQNIVVRDLVKYPSRKEEVLGTAGFMHLVGGVGAYGACLSVMLWLRQDDMLSVILVAILGLMLLTNASEIAQYWFESQVLSKYVVWVRNVVFAVFAIVKVILILNNFSLIAFAWTAVMELFVGGVLMLVALNWHGVKFKKMTVSINRAKLLILDSWPLLLSGIATVLYMKIDQIMLGQMIGDRAVGIYSAATRISEIWYFLPVGIVASVFPSILNAKTQDSSLFNERLQRLYCLMVWLAFVVAFPLTFGSKFIVTTLYGEAYAIAGSVLAIHVWASVFVFLGIAGSSWFIAENKQILGLQRTVAGAVINIILNIILIPRYHEIGAAYATLVAQMCVCLLYDVLIKETRPMFWMKIKAFNPFVMIGFITKELKSN